jgi:uroporphyrinogen decarboxylase
MMTAAELRYDRQERILRAIRGEKNDQLPILAGGTGAGPIRAAGDDVRVYDPGEFGDARHDHRRNAAESAEYRSAVAIGYSARFLGVPQLAKTYLPGVELKETDMWQPVIKKVMTDEDYDFVIENGWQKFNDICIFERLGYDPDELARGAEEDAKNIRKYYDAGYPFMNGRMLPAPLDTVCFGRGIMDFFMDMIEIPEKVSEVFNIILDEFEASQKEEIRKNIEDAKARGEVTMYTIAPCVHANCGLVSRDIFDKFGWPLFERGANLLFELGAIVFLHMDTNWTNFLDYFKSFPAGRCIFDSDGGTDLYKLKDMLGSRMAITGNIAPALLAFGTPEQIYDACRKQIEEMGDGYILAPSCSFPANMSREKIDAFYAASLG